MPSTPRLPSQYYPRLWLAAAAFGAFLLITTEILPYGHQLDRLISNALYDSTHKRFILDLPSGAVKYWAYGILKNVLLLIPAYALLQMLVGAYLRLRGRLSQEQAARLGQWAWVFFGILLSTSLISLLKKLTNQACPWHMVDYGGVWQYVDIFTTRPWPADSMQCWPGGHASGGFSLWVFVFIGGWPAAVWSQRVARPPKHWRSPTFWFWAGLLLGTFMGFTQMGFGAHYFSHQFWTLWFVGVFYLALFSARSAWVGRNEN